MRVGREQAEVIGAGGHAQHDDRATRMLRHAGRAVASAGRSDEWRAQPWELLDAHRRAYKQVPPLWAPLG